MQDNHLTVPSVIKLDTPHPYHHQYEKNLSDNSPLTFDDSCNSPHFFPYKAKTSSPNDSYRLESAPFTRANTGSFTPSNSHQNLATQKKAPVKIIQNFHRNKKIGVNLLDLLDKSPKDNSPNEQRSNNSEGIRISKKYTTLPQYRNLLMFDKSEISQEMDQKEQPTYKRQFNSVDRVLLSRNSIISEESKADRARLNDSDYWFPTPNYKKPTHGTPTNGIYRKPKEFRIKKNPTFNEISVSAPEGEKKEYSKECLICLEEFDNSQPSMKIESIKLRIHNACLKAHILQAIRDRSFPICYPVEKPKKVIKGLVFIKLLSLSEMEFYAKQQLVSKAIKNPELYMFCSTPDCQHIFKLTESPDEREKACPECKRMICSICRDCHPGLSCAEYQFTKENDEGVKLFLKEARSVQCMNCNFWIEKNGGCNHMTCRCKYQFCFLCGKKWKTCACPQMDQGNEMMNRGNERMNRGNERMNRVLEIMGQRHEIRNLENEIRDWEFPTNPFIRIGSPSRVIRRPSLFQINARPRSSLNGDNILVESENIRSSSLSPRFQDISFSIGGDGDGGFNLNNLSNISNFFEMTEVRAQDPSRLMPFSGEI